MDDPRIARGGDVGVVELDRPPANYFTASLIEQIADAADDLVNGGARVIVLGTAGKHFSGGADLTSDAMRTSRAAVAARTYAAAVRLFRVPVPVVAAVTGAAVGGGLGLACAADFRVTCPSGRFHANFAALGFHHGFGLTVSLPRIVGETAALDLLTSGRRIDGVRAHELGLADRLVTRADEVLTEALSWAREIAAAAPLAVRAITATMRGALADRVAEAVEHELAEQQRLWATDDSRIGIAAGLAGETPIFTGN